MIKNKNKNDRKENINNSNIDNQKDKMKKIILISHSKNKSADLKFSKDNSFKSGKSFLNDSYLKTDFSYKKEQNKNFLSKKEINLKNKINKGNYKNILIKNDSLPSLINSNNNSNNNSNKKKYFYEHNFFYQLSPTLKDI